MQIFDVKISSREAFTFNRKKFGNYNEQFVALENM